jgi:hypothetical protein
MKHHIGVTIDSKFLRETETLRIREKRNTLIEHLIKLGLKVYKREENQKPNVPSRKRG